MRLSGKDTRGLSDERTIAVPLEAFALLMAWSGTAGNQVPAHIRAHPAYPDHHDGKKGHLLRALTPFAQEAFRALRSPTQPQEPTNG